MKTFKIYVAAMFILFAFSACTSDKKVSLDPSNPVNITIWHYYHGTQKAAFDDMLKDFNDTAGYQQGIIVEAVSYGSVDQLTENVLAAARGEVDAGNMPDIFSSYGDTALEIRKMGLAAEIDAYLSAQELEAYDPSFLREGRLGSDKLYVFPVAKSTESLMINQTDFDQFIEELKTSGGETVGYEDLLTWEGCLRVADIYYNHTGKAFMSIDVPANYLIIGSKQLGQDIVQVENGEAAFNLDDAIMSKLWYTYYQSMVTGRFSKLGKFGSDDIKTGDSLCFVGSTSSAGYFPSELTLADGSSRLVEMQVLPHPVFENGDKVAVSQGAGMAMVKSVPEREYAAAVFLKWFTEPERNVSFSLNASYLPVTKAALNDEFLNPVFESIDTSDTVAQNSVKALRVAINQLREYHLYTSDVFEGGVNFRSKLSAPLVAAAQEDRAAYLEMLNEGLSPEQAYDRLYAGSLEKMAAWLDGLKN